jgi:two-component system NtrC family sensor kinase
MRRRTRAGGEPIKTQHRKTATSKRRNVTKIVHPSDAASLQEQLDRKAKELNESLEQQTATSEVLRVISVSPGDLKPIFAVILEHATRLCQANFGVLFLCEGNAVRAVAMHNAPSAYVELRQREPLVSMAGTTVVAEVARAKRTIQTADMAKDPAYEKNPQNTQLFVRLTGTRSYVGVPMLKDGMLIGVISIYRQEVRPFTDEQIALVQNFATQAVIAIENTRLLNELRQRTNDLTESLEQQTATSQVLNVINTSPTDTQPVFDTIIQSAVRLCGAQFGVMHRFDGERLHVVAHDVTPEVLEVLKRTYPMRPVRSQASGRAMLDRTVVEIRDVREDSDYDHAMATAGHWHSLLAVPMLRADGDAIGTIVVQRSESGAFASRLIEMLQNFAAQAVIAIENTRLLSELRQSLEQQTATADVLRVISSSRGDLEPVFQAMLENATRICNAKFGTLFLREGEALRVAAHHGSLTKAWDEQWRVGMLLQPDPALQAFQTLSAGRPLQVVDLSKAPSYLARNPKAVNSVETGGIRTMATVPMLKDGETIGVITIFRTEVREFTEKQIALVTNFAAQAVIAIENTRLLSELRESLDQQTATSEVLKVISSSPGDLEPVFKVMLENSTRICEAGFGVLSLKEDDDYRVVAMHNAPSAFVDLRRREPTFRPSGSMGSLMARAIETKRATQIADFAEHTDDPLDRAFSAATQARSIILVPILKEGAVIGTSAIFRQEVKPFNDKQVELLTNFAAQAVIAIENTRLLNELRQRTTDLSMSLEDLRTAQDRLVQTEKLASLGQLTAGIAHEIKNPLNFVSNFSSVSVELIDELREALASAPLNSKLRTEIDEIADMLQGNLDKVVQHGKRADSIVKNMLLHSREGSGDHRSVDINALVEESLNLAYHGARAEKQGFNITLERSFDPAAGEVDLYPQEVTRVLLNLISNGFYAAIKRKSQAGNGGFEPVLAATTKNLGDRVEIRIRDNGTGIPPEVKAKMFNPFFTTKPAGEGTGLGLSISHDIIVKQHAGSIAVDTAPGQFTEFKIVLPRATAAIAKPGGQR